MRESIQDVQSTNDLQENSLLFSSRRLLPLDMYVYRKPKPPESRYISF